MERIDIGGSEMHLVAGFLGVRDEFAHIVVEVFGYVVANGLAGVAVVFPHGKLLHQQFALCVEGVLRGFDGIVLEIVSKRRLDALLQVLNLVVNDRHIAHPLAVQDLGDMHHANVARDFALAPHAR